MIIEILLVSFWLVGNSNLSLFFKILVGPTCLFKCFSFCLLLSSNIIPSILYDVLCSWHNDRVQTTNINILGRITSAQTLSCVYVCTIFALLHSKLQQLQYDLQCCIMIFLSPMLFGNKYFIRLIFPLIDEQSLFLVFNMVWCASWDMFINNSMCM